MPPTHIRYLYCRFPLNYLHPQLTTSTIEFDIDTIKNCTGYFPLQNSVLKIADG